jgi:hypothetical protein
MPHVVGGGLKVQGQTVATAEIFVGGVDGLGTLVELSDGGDRSGITGLGCRPNSAGLAVTIFAAQTNQTPYDLIGATGAIVGIPTIGRFRGFGRGSLEVIQASASGLGGQKAFERVGFAHELGECFVAVAVGFQNEALSGLLIRRPANQTGNTFPAQLAGGLPATVARENLPGTNRTGAVQFGVVA